MWTLVSMTFFVLFTEQCSGIPSSSAQKWHYLQGKSNWKILHLPHKDENDADDDDSWVRRINWKVFCPTWRIADWDFWENKQSKAWDEPKSHLAVMKVLYWSAKTQILGPFPCLERHSTGFLLVWDTPLPCMGISSVWPIHTLWRLHISLSSCSFLQEEEYRDLVSISQSMEEQYGQYFDSVIPFEEVFVFSWYWNFLFHLNLFKP